MKTIKGKTLCKKNCTWCKGYKDCKEDVLKLIDEWIKKVRERSTAWHVLTTLKSKIEG